MPVTAKLSKAFYDKIGEQPANELVTWMNDVHESARADLREFNELNFTRFEARLDQRAAELDAKIDRRYGELDRQVERLDAKIDALGARIDAKFDTFAAQLDARFERAQKDMMRMLFLAWMTLLIPMLGIALRR